MVIFYITIIVSLGKSNVTVTIKNIRISRLVIFITVIVSLGKSNATVTIRH